MISQPPGVWLPIPKNESYFVSVVRVTQAQKWLWRQEICEVVLIHGLQPYNQGPFVKGPTEQTSAQLVKGLSARHLHP